MTQYVFEASSLEKYSHVYTTSSERGFLLKQKENPQNVVRT